MPILPPAENDFAAPPTPPQDPPNTHDVVSAILYETEIVENYRLHLHGDQIVPENTVVEAALYRDSVLAAHATPAPDAVPPWFLPAVNAAIDAALAPLRQDVCDMKVLLLQTANHQRGNGAIAKYITVPFPVLVNGQRTLRDPTEPPHNLPPLLTSANIRNLDPQASQDYYHGYHPAAAALPGHEERLRRIANAIGATLHG